MNEHRIYTDIGEMLRGPWDAPVRHSRPNAAEGQLSRPERIQAAIVRHALWVENKEGGQRWIVPANADLSGADLSGVNLKAADLAYVNLRGANLSGSNLDDVELQGADLRDANLSNTSMNHTILSEALLSGVNLSKARLANVRGGDIVIFQAGQHSAVFAGGNGFIGCKYFTYDEWVENYKAIGEAAGYNKAQIKVYGRMIKAAVKFLRKTEA